VQNDWKPEVYLKKTILLIWLFVAISVLYGCVKASVVVPVGDNVGVKIETTDQESTVIVNGA